MRHSKILSRLLLVSIACAMFAAMFGGLVLTAPRAHAGSCTSQSSTVITDPMTGWQWTTKWYCGNRGGAYLYGDANYSTAAAIMDSTWSWFVCWRRGVMHSGGNNIWYYSLGDRNIIPYRQPWGYMPAVDVWTSTDPWPGMPQCPVGNSPPTPVNGLNKPVIFIHGFNADGSSFNVNGNIWYNARNAYWSGDWPTLSGTLGHAWTWCYYASDSNCDVMDPNAADQNRSIKELGKDLANYLWNGWSRWGISVDVVAHSMGGLIIRSALTEVQKRTAGYPPYLYVEDVTTLSTPHRGGNPWLTTLCGLFKSSTQCSEITTGSGFLNGLYDNPQSAQGTDWTLVGADDDTTVPVWSSVPGKNSPGGNMVVAHKVIYDGNQFSNAHSDIRTTTSGFYYFWYCDTYSTGCTMADRSTFYYTLSYDPIKVARFANYYNNGW